MVVWWAREARECLPSFYYMWQASVALFVGCAPVVWLFSRVVLAHSCVRALLPAETARSALTVRAARSAGGLGSGCCSSPPPT